MNKHKVVCNGDCKQVNYSPMYRTKSKNRSAGVKPADGRYKANRNQNGVN